MSGLFGKKAQSTTPTRLNGISVNQSLYGNAIPLIYGTSRVPMMLIDYVDFKAIPQSQSSGGKGGGGGATSSYTYTASIVALLCEGPISGVNAIYKDKEQTTLSGLNLTLFKGNANQPPWTYMTSNHPDHALPYDHMAYVGGANFDLGGQAGLPNLSFEVQGFCLYAGGPDAEPSQIIVDYCTDQNHGVGFSYLANLTGTNSYQAYCVAMDFLISPQETTQRQAQEFLKEILQVTNSNAVYTPSIGLRIVPYADQAVTGNGVTYTPDLTPEFHFKDIDYLYEQGQQPVVEKPIPSNQTFNIWTVEYLNRSNQYNIDTETFRDEQDIAINGERPAPTVTLHSITRASVALSVATLLCLRNLYVRSTYTFKVRPDFSRLEPMDYVAIDDSTSGISNKLVRITEVEDAVDQDLGEVFTITAEEVLVGPASAPIYDTELAQGFAANYGADPGNVATPYIFTAPPALTTSGYEEWIAVCGVSGLWGMADVYASLDNVTYDHVGIKSGPSRYGTIVNALPAGSDPDTVNALTLAFSGSLPAELDSATRAAADGLRNLCIVDGEIISYQTVTPLGNNTFRLNYLRRGNYGSSISAHAAGAFFAILDSAIFKMPFDPGMSGQPVWFKFVSSNYYGYGTQDISKVPAFQAFFQAQNGGQLLPNGDTPLVAHGFCVNVGTRIFKQPNSTSAWDSNCFSVDEFSGGCTLKFNACQTNLSIMMGLNGSQIPAGPYQNVDFGWYVGPDGIAYIYESNVLILAARSYTTDTVFEIRYDAKYIKYYLDSVQWRITPAPGRAFFFASAFYSPTATVQNVYFGALNPANSSPFIARGQCTVSNESAQKVGGASAWDSDVFSLEGYPACHVTWKCNSNTQDLMIGLGKRPGVNSSFETIDYAFDCASDGKYRLIILGAVQSGIIGQYDSTTRFAIVYDGNIVTWTVNGATVGAVTPGATNLFLDSSFYSPGAGVNTLQYGPTTQLQFADTIQIGQNAATDVYSTTLVGPYGSAVASPAVLLATSLSFTAKVTGTFTILCTFKGGWVNGALSVTSSDDVWMELTSPILGSKISYCGQVTTTQIIYTLQLIDTMTAGDPITIKIWYQQHSTAGGRTDYVQVDNLVLRAEAVKR